MIPKKFTVVNRTWSVGGMPSGFDETKIGVTMYDQGKVGVRDVGDQIVQEHTFFHELSHIYMLALGRDDLSKDEGFIDALGGLMHQYEQTKKGEL